jgi:peptide/nickel transport system permease protein
MVAYILGRLVWGAVVLLVVAAITFVLIFMVPADPVRSIVGMRASPAEVERVRATMGLDQPLLNQLGAYLFRAAQGDLGYSYHHRIEVLKLIVQRFPATLQLAGAGTVLALGLGVPLGVLGARRRGTRYDRLGNVISVAFLSIPAFLLGYMLIYLAAFRPLVAWHVDLFPIGGYEPWSLRHLALPALTLGATSAAYYTRLARSLMLEELRQDYVRTARAKGLRERRVTWRHAFRNALPSLVTQFGLDLGFLLGGVIVVEQVFGWPGIGQLAVNAITNDDVPLIMGTVLFGTFCIVVANLVADVAIALLDPRVAR